MVAFDFKPRFVPKIERGIKTSTIRSRPRCQPGDVMQLYTGLRTKRSRLIKTVICESIYTFAILENDLVQCRHPDAGYLWRQEGFDSPKEMIGFFKDLYGFPYHGFLHQWMERPHD